jgi:hypothetical protein
MITNISLVTVYCLDQGGSWFHPAPAREGPDGRPRPAGRRLPQDLASRRSCATSGNWLVLVEPKEFTPEDFA